MSEVSTGPALSSRLDALRRRTGRPLRFLVAGAINTTFGVGIYPALMLSFPYLGAHYLLTLGIAQAMGLVFAFSIYKLGVFQTKTNLVREFGTFSTFYLVNYAANWALLPLLVQVIGIRPIIAQTGFIAVLIVGSYFWHSRVTFRDRRNLETPPN